MTRHTYDFTRYKNLAVTLLFGGLLSIGACSSPEEPPADAAESPAEAVEQEAADVQEEIGEAMGAIREYTYAEREEFGQWASEHLEEIDQKIEELNARAATAELEAQHDWETLKADLEQQRATVAAKIDEAMNATEQGWQTTSNDAAREIARFQEKLAETIEQLPPDAEDT